MRSLCGWAKVRASRDRFALKWGNWIRSKSMCS